MATERRGPARVCQAPTDTVPSILEALEASGCDVHLDEEAGTATAMDGDTRVYRAIRKGPAGPWIARTSHSDRITWR
jgi:hypothetical protein